MLSEDKQEIIIRELDDDDLEPVELPAGRLDLEGDDEGERQPRRPDESEEEPIDDDFSLEDEEDLEDFNVEDALSDISLDDDDL